MITLLILKEKPMNIGIDIDDVLAEFQIAWLDYHNKKYGTSAKKEDLTSYDYRDILNEEGDVLIQRVMDFYDTPEFANLKTTPYSKRSIQSLRGNHQLIAITSRPNKTKQTTLDWFDRHFNGAFSKIILTNQYSLEKTNKVTKLQVCQENNIGIMIEDCLEHLFSLVGNGVHGILIDKPWNKFSSSEKNINRVISWKEIPRLIESLS